MKNGFSEFNLQPFLMSALDKINFTQPTPVQEKLIPVILAGKSVVGQSQTGSGKTHTFLLPLINQIDQSKKQVQVVITTPSRELAYQINAAARQLVDSDEVHIEIGNYVGGTDKKRQMDKLKHRQPEIVIGTPGRIWDLIHSQALDVHQASKFVVDEADMTLDMGFLNEVDKIAASLPKSLQMMIFSATIPKSLNAFLKKYMSNPVISEIPVESIISPTIDNWLISTKSKGKNNVIHQLLTIGEPYLVLIFCNTKERADELTDYLKRQGLKVAKVHGGVQPRERKRVMKEIHNLDFQFVVATDLASRGIDIEGVSMVINDGIPDDLDFFIHRVGRTGRNGMSGTAITLYEPGEEEKVSEIEKLGVKFQPKAIKNGEVVDSYDRNRRTNRVRDHHKLDPTMVGMVKKKKRKVKPGYKRQIRKAIEIKDQKDRRKAQHTEFLRTKRQRIKQHRAKRNHDED
ncbi:DEAD/DEAH box helicase [Pediococcus damnosus LMG 28219]|uniref:DEAD/DEAH box helicase n=1 Tax=Pediococcus damnosus TaxID=51663 RepID=UPI00061F5C66|nr:DEAD/DEAH box helicase [Pediococcus damnosus]KJU73743.1 DEAD/DEAH box helicase [Pediococcus damnosus LMG 28219]